MMARRFTLVACGALLAACSIEEGDIEDDDAGTQQSGPVSITSLGSEELTSDGVEVELDIPAGTESFALVVDGNGTDELMLAEKLTTPTGEVVYDFQNDVSINRTDATNGLYTLLVPNNPEVIPLPGEWLVKLRSGSSAVDADLTLVTKNEPNTDNLIDLNLYFVGLEGLDAASAQTDEGFAQILSAVSSVYAGVGINTRAVTYNDITGADADTYGVIDNDAELAGLYQTVERKSEFAINLFFVEDITLGSSGFSTLGLAGGVPGPPLLQGTRRSGVAINMGSYLAAVQSGDAEMIAEASGEVEIIIAHESGHFLGLYHTVERNGQALPDGEIQGRDPLTDTPACPDTADADADGVLSPSECAGQGAENLMFWSPGNDSRTLTSGQGSVISGNPVAH